MLDTVVLKILSGQYKLLKKERWTSASEKHNNGLLVCKTYANNRTPEEKCLKIYRPRLTIVDQRGRDRHMKIEFSAQTILFGNTLEEVNEHDFEDVVGVLQKSMVEMGVSTEKEFLRHATVEDLQPAKNIPISGGYFTMGIIKDMTKVILTEKMEMDMKDFKNGGHGLQFWAETNALTFYDKIKDLEKSEAHAHSRDQEIQQANMLDFMRQKKKPEVMRMEARLCKKPKMNSVLKHLGFPINPTFADIFKNEVCKKILLYYFEKFIEPSFFIFTLDETPQGILRSLLQKNKRMSVDEAMKLAALKIFCKDEGGARGLRRIIEAKASKRKWQRIAAKLKTLNRRIPLKSCYGYIKEIKQSLQRFEPYKPEIG